MQIIYIDSNEVTTQVQQLETLKARHQNILANDPFNYQELGEIKRKIFFILGFKRVIVKIEDLVNALNQITHFSNSYLGATLTFNAWQSTRPQFDWLDNFQVNRSANKITFSGTTSETATATQIEWMQEWVNGFMRQVSQTIRDFKAIIEYKRVGELPGGVLLTRVNSYSSWIDATTKVIYS